jgi:hypothetical protein
MNRTPTAGPDARPALGDVWIILAVALAARIVFTFALGRLDPLFLVPVVDEATYLQDAACIARLGWRLDALALPFYQPPGLVFVAAALFQLGLTPAGLAIVQQALGVASALLVYAVARSWFGPGARPLARAAAVLYSFCPALLAAELKFLKPPWTIFLLLLTVFLLRYRRRRAAAIGTGLLAGALTLFEAYFVFVGVLLAAWFARERKALAVWCAAAGAAVVLPVIGLNVWAGRGPAFVSTNGGLNAWIGNNPDWRTAYNTLPGWEWQELVGRYSLGAHRPETDVREDLLFAIEVMQDVRSHPLRFARGLAEKAFLLFSARELPRNHAEYLPLPLAIWSWLCNALLVAAGALILVPPWRAPRPLAALVLIVAAVNIVFFPTSRYRLPAFPVILCALPAAAARLATRRGRLVAAGALGLSVAAGAWAGRVVDYPGWQAVRCADIGRKFLAEGRRPESRAWLEQAVRVKPIPQSLRALARYHLETDQPHLAERLLMQCVHLQPLDPRTYYDLAQLAARRNEAARAEKLYRVYVDRVDHFHYRDENHPFKLVEALCHLAGRALEAGRSAEAGETVMRLRRLLDAEPPDSPTRLYFQATIHRLEDKLTGNGRKLLDAPAVFAEPNPEL